MRMEGTELNVHGAAAIAGVKESRLSINGVVVLLYPVREIRSLRKQSTVIIKMFFVSLISIVGTSEIRDSYSNRDFTRRTVLTPLLAKSLSIVGLLKTRCYSALLQSL